YVTGIRSHNSWEGVPFPALTAYLSSRYARVHVVSRRLLEIFAPALRALSYVTHGVDTEAFTPRTTAGASARPAGASAPSVAPAGGRLRLGWAGNRETPAKGFARFVEPLGKIPGVELVICG